MPPADQTRRQIHRMRSGAGQASIPTQFGNIVALIATEHRLYLIGEHGVSSGVMADQIDPRRENPDIPQIVQRQELGHGADSPFVQLTLCTAAALLDPTYLPDGFPRETVLLSAMKVAQELGAITDTIAELRRHEANTRHKLGRGEIDRGHLPNTPNLRGRVEQAVNQLRKVQVETVAIAHLFYPKATPNAPWIDPVRAGLEGDPFLEFLEHAAATLTEVANCRNAMIHGDATKRLEILDYDLGADGRLVAPTIELVHPQTPLSRRDTVQYLEGAKDRLADVFANFLATFCDRNVRVLLPAFASRVVALPEGQLRSGSPLVWETQLREGFELQTQNAADAASGQSPA